MNSYETEQHEPHSIIEKWIWVNLNAASERLHSFDWPIVKTGREVMSCRNVNLTTTVSYVWGWEAGNGLALTDGIDIVNSTDEKTSKHGEPAIRTQHRNGEEMSDCQRDQATSGAPWGWIFSFVETRQRDHHKTPKWAADCHVDISLTGSPFSQAWPHQKRPNSIHTVWGTIDDHLANLPPFHVQSALSDKHGRIFPSREEPGIGHLSSSAS